MTVTISREFATELTEVIEDAVEYACQQSAANGEYVSGETCWKIIAAFAMAKEAEFAGYFNEAN